MPTIKTLLIDLPEYSGFFHLLVKSVDAQAGRNDSRGAKHISQRFIRGLSQVVKINLCSDPAPEWRAPTAQVRECPGELKSRFGLAILRWTRGSGIPSLLRHDLRLRRVHHVVW